MGVELAGDGRVVLVVRCADGQIDRRRRDVSGQRVGFVGLAIERFEAGV